MSAHRLNAMNPHAPRICEVCEGGFAERSHWLQIYSSGILVFVFVCFLCWQQCGRRRGQIQRAVGYCGY